MATIDITTDFAPTGHSFTTTIVARIAAVRARARKHYEYRQMLSMEDHLLRDIGITRADIRNAMTEVDGR